VTSTRLQVIATTDRTSKYCISESIIEIQKTRFSFVTAHLKISKCLTALLLIAIVIVITPRATAQTDTTFRFSLTEGAPKNFIQATGGGPQQYVSMLIFDPLVMVDIKTFEILPALAQSWDISPDGLTYTFHLVKATWHDGVPFTSADVKYTFDYIITNKLDGYGFIMGISNIATPDDSTVVITLAIADAAFLIKVNGRASGLEDILPKHILEGTDWTKDEDFLQHPIGTGPYKFDSYDGMNVVLVRNDQYFAGQPAFAKVIATVIPSTTLAAKAFEANEIDYLQADQVPSVAEFLRLKALPGNTGDTYPLMLDILLFNVHRKPLDNVNVRQAFSYAIDRNEIVKKVYLGTVPAQNNVFFPDWLTWATDPNMKLPDYNPDKANQLLDEAGYPRGSDGMRFTIKISYAAPYTPPPEYVDVLKSQLAIVGINVQHEPNEWDVWYQKVFKNFEYDVALSGMSIWGDPGIGPADRLVPGRLYYFGYNNTDIIQKFSQAGALTDKTERGKLYSSIQAQLLKDLPAFSINQEPRADLWKSKFTGILKGDLFRLRFAEPVQVTTSMTAGPTTAMTTSPITTTTTEVDYTSYVLGIIAILAVAAAGTYAYSRRKKTPKS
jgi:peptide/nickel transport system substrate-binding protein